MMWGTKEVSPVSEWEQRAFPLRPPDYCGRGLACEQWSVVAVKPFCGWAVC